MEYPNDLDDLIKLSKLRGPFGCYIGPCPLWNINPAGYANASSIAALAWRADVAECEAERLRFLLKRYEQETFPALIIRADKAERERDAAIKTIEWIVKETDCPPEICREICGNHDGICAEHAKIGHYDRCKGFKWIGGKEK